MNVDINSYTLKSGSNLGRIDLVVAAVGIILSIAGFMSNHEHFYYSYLLGFAFWVSIALGALFFTMLQHLTNASWSVTVRRISEGMTAPLPWLFLLFIPIFFGMHDLYHWTHAEVVAADAALQAKAPYLNVTFFSIRTVLYFAIWSGIAFYLRHASKQQDKGNGHEWALKMRKVSAIGMLLFAVTISLAAFDWLMSLDPHWYSTIFGVYYFGGAFLSSLAMMVFIALYLRNLNVLKKEINKEHYQDLGKLMFGFTIFWAYIAYSQYFIQWYGNVPEETVWYLRRWDGTDGTSQWLWVSMILIFGQFTIPFIVLIFRSVKRNMVMMRIMAVWLLLMHWFDIYWLVFPTLYEGGPQFSWIDLGPTFGIGGIFMWLFWVAFRSAPVLPVGDPQLKKSLSFVNQ